MLIDPEYKSRDRLSAMTVRQLRDYARRYHVCVGNEGSTKDGIVQAIGAQMEYRIREAEVDHA